MTPDKTLAEADLILKMIEEVDPNDTEKLDEIDARVWCWLNGRQFHGWDGKARFRYNLFYPLSMPHPRKRINNDMQYTRSRDALKMIRPEWFFPIIIAKTNGLWCAEISLPDRPHEEMGEVWQTFASPDLPTEELAELHAIIQAHKWEKEHGQ